MCGCYGFMLGLLVSVQWIKGLVQLSLTEQYDGMSKVFLLRCPLNNNFDLLRLHFFFFLIFFKTFQLPTTPTLSTCFSLVDMSLLMYFFWNYLVLAILVVMAFSWILFVFLKAVYSLLIILYFHFGLFYEYLCKDLIRQRDLDFMNCKH